MSEETKITTNKSLPPTVLAGVLGIGVVAFFVGRGSAPVNTSPAVSESAEDGHEHGEEGHGDEHSEEIKFEGNTAKEAGIVVAPVSLQLQTSGIPFNGQIAANPNSLVRVSSLVPGRIASLRVSPGDKVTKGQTLAVVESRAIGEAQSIRRSIACCSALSRIRRRASISSRAARCTSSRSCPGTKCASSRRSRRCG